MSSRYEPPVILARGTREGYDFEVLSYEPRNPKADFVVEIRRVPEGYGDIPGGYAALQFHDDAPRDLAVDLTIAYLLSTEAKEREEAALRDRLSKLPRNTPAYFYYGERFGGSTR